MARKVVFFAHAGIVGTDTAQGFIFDDDVTDEMLSDDAWQFALDHAEGYGIYWSPNMVDAADEDEDEDEDEDGDQYSDSIEGWWEDYVPEKHDGKITYGNGEHMFDDCTRK